MGGDSSRCLMGGDLERVGACTAGGGHALPSVYLIASRLPTVPRGLPQ